MTKLFMAKDIVNKSTQLLTQQCLELSNNGLKPRLDVILVGKNPASELYVKNKKKMCELVGADFNLIRLKEDITEESFLAEVQKMNSNPKTTGCFVQLPIPKRLNNINITEMINPDKDVDGFHSKNIMALYNQKPGLISCTPKGILKLLTENKVQLTGKSVVIIGRGFIVGKPLSLLLQNNNATVTMCHSQTSDIKVHTKKADIIISAAGKANFIDSSYLNQDTDQILIDVGINRDENGLLCGDIKQTDVMGKAYAITPVPGGVGPMTVYSLIENLIESTTNILNKRK